MSSVNDLPLFDLNEESAAADLANAVNSSRDPVKIRVIEKGKTDMAIGVALPRNHPSSVEYLKNTRDYNDENKDIYDQIDLCRKLYVWEGIIGTVVDMYTDLAYSPIAIDGIKPNSKEAKLIRYFLDNVNIGNNNIPKGIDALNKSISFEYNLAGNAFVYSKWGSIYVDELKNKYRLPMSIVTLDPSMLEIPKDSVLFGNKVIKISAERIFGSALLTRQQKQEILSKLPTKVRNKIKTNTDMELNSEVTYHFKRKGSMYNGWGIPALTRVFPAIASKRKLRALDDSTIEGMVNSITIFKIGDKDKPETWDVGRLTAFASLLAKPSSSMTLVWSWDVEHIHVSPSGDILQFADRYKDANTDILYALGFPVALLTGEGAKAGDVWASVIFTVERLQDYRDEFKCFMEGLLKQILVENGFANSTPRVRLIKPKINKDDIRNIALAFYDRGLLSKRTTMEEAGYNLDSERDRRSQESDDGTDDDMIRPNTPFSSDPNGGDQPGTPNPQSKDTMKEKTNIKKETKETEVNQKEKKIPRLEGNTKDRIIAIFERTLKDDMSPADAKRTLYAMANVIYNFGDSINGENIIGINYGSFVSLVDRIVKGIKKNETSTKSIIMNKLSDLSL